MDKSGDPTIAWAVEFCNNEPAQLQTNLPLLWDQLAERLPHAAAATSGRREVLWLDPLADRNRTLLLVRWWKLPRSVLLG